MRRTHKIELSKKYCDKDSIINNILKNINIARKRNENKLALDRRRSI